MGHITPNEALKGIDHLLRSSIAAGEYRFIHINRRHNLTAFSLHRWGPDGRRFLSDVPYKGRNFYFARDLTYFGYLYRNLFRSTQTKSDLLLTLFSLLR